MAEIVDAVVVGAGPNGLVAANALADAGWDVVLLEANDEVGGAVRSGRPWPDHPDATVDLFSAVYPLAAASPVLRRFDLEAHGLRWERAPRVIAHLADPSQEAVVLHPEPEATAAALDRDTPGDGEAWLRLFAQWQRISEPMLEALFTPLPPVRPAARLLHRLGGADAVRLARLATLPVTRFGSEEFTGQAARLLFAGNAMHADVPMDGAGSGLYGWLLAMVAQDVGFPVPRGGAGALSGALASRATAAGVSVRSGQRVTRVLVRSGRAVGVRTAGGERVFARRAVLASVDAPRLYRDLVGADLLPPRMRDDLARFEWDLPTVKVNWLVRDGIPWRATEASQAGTVHLGADLSGLSRWSADLTWGRESADVFALLGQMTTTDPTRSPQGTDSVWAYTHLARGHHTDADGEQMAARLDDLIERFAPGFGERVLARYAQLPSDLEAADANLHHGAINGGTAQLHQQLIFRPVTGLGGPETVIDGLYLAGASVHPGGGVHGGCGWIAARRALADQGYFGPARRLVRRAVARRVYGEPTG
jgi:phytoene dehydrogenase-like protein